MRTRAVPARGTGAPSTLHRLSTNGFAVALLLKTCYACLFQGPNVGFWTLGQHPKHVVREPGMTEQSAFLSEHRRTGVGRSLKAGVFKYMLVSTVYWRRTLAAMSLDPKFSRPNIVEKGRKKLVQNRSIRLLANARKGLQANKLDKRCLRRRSPTLACEKSIEHVGRQTQASFDRPAAFPAATLGLPSSYEDKLQASTSKEQKV